jgi:hypothetical protein
MGQAVTVSTSAGRAVSLAQFVYAGGMLPIAQSRQPTKKTTCCVVVVTNGFAAPVLVSAVLTGAHVDISFDIPTNMGGMSGNFSCGRVLDTTTVALLGNGMLISSPLPFLSDTLSRQQLLLGEQPAVGGSAWHWCDGGSDLTDRHLGMNTVGAKERDC